MSEQDPEHVVPSGYHFDPEGMVLEGPDLQIKLTSLIVMASQVPTLALACLAQAAISVTAPMDSAFDDGGALIGAPIPAHDVATFMTPDGIAGIAVRVGSAVLPIAIHADMILSLADELRELAAMLQKTGRA